MLGFCVVVACGVNKLLLGASWSLLVKSSGRFAESADAGVLGVFRVQDPALLPGTC